MLFQKQIAEIIGVDEVTIYNWESNRNEPALQLIPRIIEFLGYCRYTADLPVVEKLRVWRQSIGFSQKRMAEALGIDEGTLRGLETGSRKPAEKYLESIRAFIPHQIDG